MKLTGFNKIVIVSLCDRYTKSLAKHLSQTLEMLFCDTKELLAYELIDKKRLKKFVTKEYLDNAERSVFKHISSFENVVVSINFDCLKANYDLLRETSLIVFVKLSKTYVKEKASIINTVSYDLRSQELQELANISIAVKKTEVDYVSNKIIDLLGEFI